MLISIIWLLLTVFSPHASFAVTTQLPKTGQTDCHDTSGNSIQCKATGQDGEIQAGVALPVPRFTDQGNGTVVDNLTGLIWVKNADCFVHGNWYAALAAARSLQDGQCGLIDHSVAGDWRLPNVNELESLLDMSHAFPALAPNPFILEQAYYWSSSTHAHYSGNAWVVSIGLGNVESGVKKDALFFVWPVRGGM